MSGRRGTMNLEQVATAAAVSVATASRVLSGGPGRVAEATRQRVLAAAEDLGWTPTPRGPHAPRPVGRPRALRDLGLLVEREQLDAFARVSAFYSRLFWAMTLAAQERGRRLRLVAAPRPGADELRVIRAARLDGAIMHGHQGGLDLAAIDRVVPVVVVNGTPGLGVTTIGPDGADGIAQIVRHLLDLGHRRIAYFGINDGAPGAGPNLQHVARGEAFAGQVRLHGLGEARQVVLPGRDRPLEEVVEAQLCAWLAEPAPPTAVIGAADVHALAFHHAARGLGLRLPDQLSIVGYDDTEGCLAVTPALTSVRQPLEAMAAAAVEALLARMADPRLPTVLTMLRGTLVARASSAAPGG